MIKPKNTKKQVKLLIVDDEERLLRVLRLGLKSLNYEIRTAPNGEVALKELMANQYDLILTDLKMPQMNGAELVFEMERLNLKIPTIVMTAYADVDSAVKTLKHGASDYIKKPFTIDELEHTIHRALMQAAVANNNIIDQSLKEAVNKKEREIIEKALIQTKGNKVAAAKLLNISERTLWYKLKKYKIAC